MGNVRAQLVLTETRHLSGHELERLVVLEVSAESGRASESDPLVSLHILNEVHRRAVAALEQMTASIPLEQF